MELVLQGEAGGHPCARVARVTHNQNCFLISRHVYCAEGGTEEEDDDKDCPAGALILLPLTSHLVLLPRGTHEPTCQSFFSEVISSRRGSFLLIIVALPPRNHISRKTIVGK